MKKLAYGVLAVLFVFTATAPSVLGQATASATLQGTVIDQSQATVPGAEVKITEKETGLTRSTTTNDSGLYRFDLLPSGDTGAYWAGGILLATTLRP